MQPRLVLVLLQYVCVPAHVLRTSSAVQTHAGWFECEDTQQLRPSTSLPDAQQRNISGSHQ